MACAFFTSYKASAQEIQSRRLIMDLGIGANYSYLTYSDKAFNTRFPNVEYRLEFNTSIPVKTAFAVSTGMRFGVKQNTNSSIPFLPIDLVDIDEIMSSNDHFYLEIPLRLVYVRQKMSFGLGGLVRYYFKISEPRQYFLSNAFEFGISPNLTYKIYKRVELAGEYYLGVTPVYKFFYNNQSEFKSLSVFNNHFGFSIRYILTPNYK